MNAANAASFEDRLPIFLEPEREQEQQRAELAPADEPLWDEDRNNLHATYERPHMPDPELLEPPPLPSRSTFPAFIARTALLALVAAAVAGAVVFRQDVVRLASLLTADVKLPSNWTSASLGKSADQNPLTPFGSRFDGNTPAQAAPAAQAPAPAKPAAKLVASQEPPHSRGEAFPLGVTVYGEAKGGTLTVAGLATGATLSAGRIADGNVWRLAASELNNVMIQPPASFTGTMDLAVELRTADGAVSDRKSLRFQWAEPAVAQVMAAGDAVHHLDPEEVASLLKRGDDLIASGDFAAARLVLRRAAEAADAHAAMKLAGTYDPAVLAKLSVYGVVPDVAMARTWYEKARKFGSPDAGVRIEALAARRQ